jgi:hypothetical protein
VRGDNGRRTVHVAGLAAKLVRLPRGAVARTLQDDLGAGGGHICEQPVGVDDAQGREGVQEGRASRRQAQRKQLQAQQGARHTDKGRETRARDAVGGGPLHPLGLDEQPHGQHDREVVEEGVVPGEQDQDLQRDRDPRAGVPQPARPKEQEGRKQLGRKCECRGGFLDERGNWCTYHVSGVGSGCVTYASHSGTEAR